jgi:DNA-binding transcriptional regulator YdaS (Cro superfamily)
MTLAEYVKTTTPTQFAARLGVCSAMVSHWLHGRHRVTAERAKQIEQVTGGAVTAAELRPDIFGDRAA